MTQRRRGDLAALAVVADQFGKRFGVNIDPDSHVNLEGIAGRSFILLVRFNRVVILE